MSRILDLVEEHSRYRSQCLNLQASENVLSPAALKALGSDMASRYSLLMNGEDAYGGTKFTLQIAEEVEKLARHLFGSEYAEVRPIGGHIASQAALLSLLKKRDNMMSIAERDGGYTGYQNGYLPKMFGFQNYDIPYDSNTQEIDFARLEKLARIVNPKVFVLGQSFFVKEYDLKSLKQLSDEIGSYIVYDGSHVLGLIAGGVFQRDVLEHADLLIGSTHKSFFGPQGGIILTNNSDLISRVRENLTWRSMDNFHPSRLAALGVAMEEMIRNGREYAEKVVKNTKSLSSALDEAGIHPRFSPWYSETHQILIDSKSLSDMGLSFLEFSKRLENNNIIVDREGRVGTAEATRMGVESMEEVARLMASAAKGQNVREKVMKLVSNLRMRFT
ncbi:MAG TPA: beta-eliminating lyase-related protein [Thermoplasmataceae archaeon]|nr:serine hydroxymethyltransferase [Thermoplasmatales archaeon AK]HLH85875.1 beta-eliminating lyase-related protein [Thermoplasmataceae archaeon]